MNSSEIIVLLLGVSGIAYAVLIFFFTYGWTKLKKSQSIQKTSIKISVIIPVRNEQEHIGTLIRYLRAQEYPDDQYEIIVIDDHSDDNTVSELKSNDPGNRIKLLTLEGELKGKKNAIAYGIQKASGRLIATIDADCIPGKSWLMSIAQTYVTHNFKMMAAPVAIQDPASIIEKFQALELLSLIGTGAGAIGIEQPIMCNGANLIYEKTAFEEVGGFSGNEHIPGGDDIFLLEKFKRAFSAKKIGFIKEQDAIVFTKGVSGTKAFLNQRIRWVSKSPAYRNPAMIITAIIVLIFNLALMISLVGVFFNLIFLYSFAGLLLLKCIVDFPILWMATGFIKQRCLMSWYLPFQLVYYTKYCRGRI